AVWPDEVDYRIGEGFVGALAGPRDVAAHRPLTLLAALRVGALHGVAAGDELVLERGADSVPLDVRAARPRRTGASDHLGLDAPRAGAVPAEEIVGSVSAAHDHPALLRAMKAKGEDLLVEPERVNLDLQVEARDRRVLREEGKRNVLQGPGAQALDEVAGGRADDRRRVRAGRREARRCRWRGGGGRGRRRRARLGGGSGRSGDRLGMARRGPRAARENARGRKRQRQTRRRTRRGMEKAHGGAPAYRRLLFRTAQRS